MRLAEKLRRLEVFPGELAVCWLGQAGFFLKDHQGNTLVIDPYLTNCGEQIRGFKRISPVLMEPEELEALTDARAWPFPVYSELLFSV